MAKKPSTEEGCVDALNRAARNARDAEGLLMTAACDYAASGGTPSKWQALKAAAKRATNAGHQESRAQSWLEAWGR